MRDILTELVRWQENDKSTALATVVRTWGSSPRGMGSKMALTSDGKITGSVSGGCVENAVVEAGLQTLKTNQPRLLHFGIADETAWEVGLACGGNIDVFVKPLDKSFFKELRSVIEGGYLAVTVMVVRGPDDVLGSELLIYEDGRYTGSLGSDLDKRVLDLASGVFLRGTSQIIALDDDIDLFFEAILPPPALIMVGGVHIAVTLTSIAKKLGYQTIIIDPRKAWGNRERFPEVDQLIQAWPDETFGQIKITRFTAIVMLTHDPNMDDPALKIALTSPAFYVGALGSKTTQARRHERLLNGGLTEAQLSRLHAPVGLDIGAQSPEEIALSIMAEVVEAHRR